MPFEFSCFVSYRHPGQELGSRFVSSFVLALQEELDATGFPPAYWDKERLTGGTKWKKALEINLCRSVCMVAVVDRSYFSSEHIVCVQEFKAMEGLEQTRLPIIYKKEPITKSLIIPVCFRGFDYLPPAVRGLQIENFMNYEKRHKDLGKTPWAARKIKAIAKQISDWCNVFIEHEDLFGDCEGFNFPKKKPMQEWIRLLDPAPVTLPGR